MSTRVARFIFMALLLLGTCSTFTIAVQDPPDPTCPRNWPTCPAAYPPAPLHR